MYVLFCLVLCWFRVDGCLDLILDENDDGMCCCVCCVGREDDVSVGRRVGWRYMYRQDEHAAPQGTSVGNPRGWIWMMAGVWKPAPLPHGVHGGRQRQTKRERELTARMPAVSIWLVSPDLGWMG